MLDFTDEQIMDILINLLGTNDIRIKPVGNHHLKRHLVYEVEFAGEKKYVFKLYYIKERRNRELTSLNLLESSTIRSPKILKYGNLHNGSEWLMTQYLEGELFDKVMDDLSYENKLRIFGELGEELGKLHSITSFDFICEVEENNQNKRRNIDSHKNFVKGMEEIIEKVLNQNLPNKKILMEAIKQIRDNYHILDINFVPRLIHGDFDGRNILVKKIGDIYSISGIIDFEGSHLSNSEKDFVSLYYRYFFYDDNYKETFLNSYSRLIDIKAGFNERLYLYILCFLVENCRWTYIQAPQYYEDNIEFLEKILAVGYIKCI